jgi:hypothetical protein
MKKHEEEGMKEGSYQNNDPHRMKEEIVMK